MATINKVRVGGSNYDIEDTTARTNASNAQSIANNKADINNIINSPWLRSVIFDNDSYIMVVTASIHEANIEITTPYGNGAYWKDLLLNIPSNCQPDNGFYSVFVSANMLNNVGAISCVVMSYSKEQILIRLLNPASGSFTFDLMIQALGY